MLNFSDKNRVVVSKVSYLGSSIRKKVTTLEEIVSANDSSSAMERREKIINLQNQMMALTTYNPDDFPLKHTFTEGCYAREMLIRRGMLIIGKIHKHAHLNFVMKGDVSVFTEEGLKRITGPCYFVSSPGTKRVVLAHEDTLWVTVHITEETDLEKIEDQIIAKNYQEIGLEDPALKTLIPEESK